MALTTDFTSPSYDAYANIAEVDALIFATVAITKDDFGYSDLNVLEKEIHIRHASTQIVDINFRGILHEDVIAPRMVFPRSGLTYENGVEVDENSVPIQVKNLLVCKILDNLRTGIEPIQAIKTKKVGDVSITYADKEQSINKIEEDVCIKNTIPHQWVAYSSTLGIGSVGKKKVI